MKVIAITREALDDWNAIHGTHDNFCDLSDEAFQIIATGPGGQTFQSVKEFIAELNALGTRFPHDCLFRLVEKPKTNFTIASVTRDDLECNGFAVESVTDAQMEELADKMSDDYHGQLYHTSLRIIAEEMDIPKIEDFEFKKKALETWNRHAHEAQWDKYDQPDEHCAECNILLAVENLTFEGYGVITAGEKEVVELSCTTADGKTYDLI